MRSGEGFNPLRSFQSQADERTPLPLGLGDDCHGRSVFQDNGVSANVNKHGGGVGVRVPVAAEDLGCTVARCSGGAPSARRSRVCERERCRGCCRTPPRPGLCPHAPVSTAMLRRARGWLRSERLSGGAAGRWRGVGPGCGGAGGPCSVPSRARAGFPSR